MIKYKDINKNYTDLPSGMKAIILYLIFIFSFAYFRSTNQFLFGILLTDLSGQIYNTIMATIIPLILCFFILMKKKLSYLLLLFWGVFNLLNLLYFQIKILFSNEFVILVLKEFSNTIIDSSEISFMKIPLIISVLLPEFIFIVIISYLLIKRKLIAKYYN